MKRVNSPIEMISRAILVVRGHRVIFDRELAAIYGVDTKRLNEQVKRNIKRFPEDFMFQLSAEEAERSRSQFATLNVSRGQNLKYLPRAFTEYGAIQAANILNASRAISMSVYVVRAFIRVRELLGSNKSLAEKLDELERKYEGHDKAIATMFSAIRQLIDPPSQSRRGIGFTADFEEEP